MAKAVKKEVPAPPANEPGTAHLFKDFTIKEIMVQKQCTREEAIKILQNPTKE